MGRENIREIPKGVIKDKEKERAAFMRKAVELSNVRRGITETVPPLKNVRNMKPEDVEQGVGVIQELAEIENELRSSRFETIKYLKIVLNRYAEKSAEEAERILSIKGSYFSGGNEYRIVYEQKNLVVERAFMAEPGDDDYYDKFFLIEPPKEFRSKLLKECLDLAELRERKKNLEKQMLSARRELKNPTEYGPTEPDKERFDRMLQKAAEEDLA